MTDLDPHSPATPPSASNAPASGTPASGTRLPGSGRAVSRLAWVAYGLALFIIVLDQLTKIGVTSMAPYASIPEIPPGYPFATIIPGIFDLTMVRNPGVSFGLLGDGSARWFLSVFSVAVAIGLSIWVLKADRRLLVLAIGLVIGGAIGNAIDRIRFGYVVDFLDFSGTGLFPWVFNVADSAITVGVILLILDSFLSERKAGTVGAANEKS